MLFLFNGGSNGFQWYVPPVAYLFFYIQCRHSFSGTNCQKVSFSPYFKNRNDGSTPKMSDRFKATLLVWICFQDAFTINSLSIHPRGMSFLVWMLHETFCCNLLRNRPVTGKPQPQRWCLRLIQPEPYSSSRIFFACKETQNDQKIRQWTPHSLLHFFFSKRRTNTAVPAKTKLIAPMNWLTNRIDFGQGKRWPWMRPVLQCKMAGRLWIFAFFFNFSGISPQAFFDNGIRFGNVQNMKLEEESSVWNVVEVHVLVICIRIYSNMNSWKTHDFAPDCTFTAHWLYIYGVQCLEQRKTEVKRLQH